MASRVYGGDRREEYHFKDTPPIIATRFWNPTRDIYEIAATCTYENQIFQKHAHIPAHHIDRAKDEIPFDQIEKQQVDKVYKAVKLAQDNVQKLAEQNEVTINEYVARKADRFSDVSVRPNAVIGARHRIAIGKNERWLDKRIAEVVAYE